VTRQLEDELVNTNDGDQFASTVESFDADGAAMGVESDSEELTTSSIGNMPDSTDSVTSSEDEERLVPDAMAVAESNSQEHVGCKRG